MINMKYVRKVLILIFIIMPVFLFTLNVNAGGEKSLSIIACNLSFQDSVKLMYAVDSTNISDKTNIKVLVWTSYQNEYLKGDEDYTLSYYRSEEIAGKEYTIFLDANVAAKQMTDDYYLVPYYNDNGVDIYGNVVKYSILQYTKNMYGSAKSNDLLDDTIEAMLEYGACTQKLFDYHTDRLANDEYFEIKLVEGFLEDNTTHGLYLKNQKVTISTNFEEFVCWEENNTLYNTDKTFNYSVTKDIKLTAKERSKGLVYQLINNDTEYEVTGIGTCEDLNIVIPYKYNGLPVTSIGTDAFKSSEIKSVVMTDNIKNIGSSAFSYCEKLTDVILSNNIEEINKWTFLGCSSLKSINLGDKLTAIYQAAFQGCVSLKTIELPSSLEEIDFDAFRYCTSLEYIRLPGNIKEVNNGILDSCTSLKYVILEDGIEDIYSGAFDGCTQLTKIVLPKTYAGVLTESIFDDCSNFRSIMFSGNPTELKDIYTSVYVDNHYEFYCYCEDITGDIDYCWRYVDNEPKKWISEELKFNFNDYDFEFEVYSDAVDYEEIEFDELLIIPSTYKYENHPLPVTSISEHAFQYTTGFKDLIIPDNITSIGEGAFTLCTDLENLYIGNGVTYIPLFTFQSCYSLKTIVMGSGVETIGAFAFSFCDELEKIYYVGTLEEWDDIEINDYNEPLTKATIYAYSETEPVSEGNYWHYVDGVVTEW